MKLKKNISFMLILICIIGCGACVRKESNKEKLWVMSYEKIIEEVAEDVFSVDDTYSHHYIIYNIDKDETPELFIKRGKSEADYVYQIYSYSNELDRTELIAEISAFHVGAVFGSKSDEKQFYTSATHMGLLIVNKFELKDGKIISQKIFEGELTDNLNLEYTKDTIQLEMCPLNDKTVLNKNTE